MINRKERKKKRGSKRRRSVPAGGEGLVVGETAGEEGGEEDDDDREGQRGIVEIGRQNIKSRRRRKAREEEVKAPADDQRGGLEVGVGGEDVTGTLDEVGVREER